MKGRDCYRCWLYHNDVRYNQHWSDSPEPGLIEKAVNFTGAIVKHIASGGKKATPEQLKERLTICDGCEQKKGNSCKLCGCALSIKASWTTQKCPLDKWPPIEEPTSET